MARYRKVKRFRKGRRTRRRRTRKVTNYDPRNARPFADKYKFNMRYVQAGALDPSATNFAIQTWCLNALYDPDTTGTGHQPMGFDQLAALYGRYLVTGAKITTTFESRSVNANQTAMVGMTVHENATFYPSTLGDVSKLVEQGKTIYKYLGTSTSGRSVTTLTRKVSMRKEFQVKDLIGNIEEYGALTSAAPSNGLFCTCWAVSPDGTDDPIAVNWLTKIEFTGCFIEPLLLGQS